MINYNLLLDYYKIENSYKNIVKRGKHKQKFVKFELFKFTNFMYIYKILKSRCYKHANYNIFFIKYPRYRIILSENIIDKIISELVSSYILIPVIKPRLIITNIASIEGRGLSFGISYIKKYLNKLTINYPNVFVLKCDISKYFYNISHDILIQKLDEIIIDKEILNLLKEYIDSTNKKYVNEKIEKLIKEEIDLIKKSNHTEEEKEQLLLSLKNVLKYENGKGLAPGSTISQILAVFYLNDFDHYVKEKLKIKYYVRYMDDFILLHHDKEYLKYCKEKIEKELNKINLKLNNKTEIKKLTSGFVFLGYRFLIKNKRIYVLPNSNMKTKIRKKYKKEGRTVLRNYNGYLKSCKCGKLIYDLGKR